MKAFRLLITFVIIFFAGAVNAQNASPRTLLARGGTLVMKVGDFGAARQQVVDFARGLGGEVSDARTHVSDKGRRHGWLRIRITAVKLPALLVQIRGIGSLYADRVTTEDLSSEYTELGRRAFRLREHQQRLAGILQGSKKLRGGDILFLQERLFRASVDEDLLTQRQLLLERRDRISSITVELFEPISTRTLDKANTDLRSHFAWGWQSALSAANRLIARALTLSAYAFVFAPIWIPLLVISILVCRFVWRRSGTLRGIAGDALLSVRQRRVRPSVPPAPDEMTP